MGYRYTVKVWGRHDSFGYSYLDTWGGQSLLRAFIELWKARRQGFGCTVLEMR